MTDLYGLDWPHVDWAVAVVMVPLIGAMLAFAVPRAAPTLGIASVAATGASVLALGLQVVGAGALTVPLGGWGAPLGIDLRADGLSVAMLGMTAGVGLLVSLSALGERDARQRRYFWPLWLLLLCGLNGVYLSGDLFNLYVMIEVISIAAIGLTVLRGNLAALKAGLEYLFASMLGAILFLLAVGLVYLHYGRLDIAGLSGIAGAGDSVLAAVLALVLVGMALKTALFPLHYWLPAAHANASSPASALLSALVVKASLYIVLRLFQYLVAPSEVMVTLIGTLGAVAMLWGGIQALRAARLKLLVAWSTVAQIGLVFVAFARAGADGTAESWKAAALIMLAHALAKAAMFLAAGRIREEVGHDEIARLDRSPIRPTLAQFTFALAAVSLIGLPPTAGFAGKWLLMEGAVAAGYWHWVAVTLVGTLISVAVFSRVLAGFLRFDRVRGPLGEHQGWALADAPPLALALAALGLGLMAVQVLTLLEIGAPLGVGP